MQQPLAVLFHRRLHAADEHAQVAQRLVADIVAHAEVAAVGVAQCLKDSGLAVSSGAEHLDDLLGLFLLLEDLPVFVYDLPHALFDGIDHLGCQLRFGRYRIEVSIFGLMPLECAVVAFGDRVLNAQVCTRVQLFDGTSQYHIEGTYIGTHT